MTFYPSARHVILGFTMFRLAAALTLLASSNNNSLTAISFDHSANKHTLSFLTRIPINGSGTLVAGPTSSDVILQVDEGNFISAFGVKVQAGNVTLMPMWEALKEKEARACTVEMHDGRKVLLPEDEVEDVRRLLEDSGGARQARDSEPQVPWSNTSGSKRGCSERLLEHTQGLGVLDSSAQVLQFVTRDEGCWALKRTANVSLEGHNAGVNGALTSGDSLYLLEPRSGLLTHHYFGEQDVPPQHIYLNTSRLSSSPIQHAKLLLSSRTKHFPRSYIYVTRGDMLFVIAPASDPADPPQVVARITTTLTSITSAMLASDEGRYLVLGGEGGLRVYQRMYGGAGLAEVARMKLKDRVDSLFWL